MVEQKQGEREISASDVPLWTTAELNEALASAGVLVRRVESELSVSGVNIDSRGVSPGDLFVALAGDPGSRFHVSSRSDRDGHDFVAAARAQGARAAVVSRPTVSQQEDEGQFSFIEVTDTYDALWALGRAAGARYQGTKVAITGSSGKTTLKSMLQAVLGGYASPGSFNNHIGVPLSLATAPRTRDPAVFEIGTSHPGEIEPLAQLVEPTVAVVLNVGLAHAENFSSDRDLYVEKMSIFDSLKTKHNAVWEYSLDWSAGLSFGAERQADVHLLSLDGDLARFNVCGKEYQGRVPGGGVHRAWTLCAALACCQLLDHDLEPVLNLSGEVVPDGRGNEIHVGERIIVNDSYNANPDSMLRAIETFLARAETSKVLVVGEMLELGQQADRAHEEVARALTGQAAILVGPGFAAAAKTHGLRWVAEADETLLTELDQACGPGCAVFIKGSNRVFWQAGFVDRLRKMWDR